MIKRFALAVVLAVVAVILPSVAVAGESECTTIECVGGKCTFVAIECPIVVYVRDPEVEASYQFEKARSALNRFLELEFRR